MAACPLPYLVEIASNSSTIIDKMFPSLPGISWKTTEVCSSRKGAISGFLAGWDRVFTVLSSQDCEPDGTLVTKPSHFLYLWPLVKHIHMCSLESHCATLPRHNYALIFGRGTRGRLQAEGRLPGPAWKISLGWKPNKLKLLIGFYPGLKENMCVCVFVFSGKSFLNIE